MLTLEKCESKKSWQRVVEQHAMYDFGHTYEFHKISECNGEGRPILFNVKDESGASVLCWPGLLRTVDQAKHTDVTSVYGYSGPLINNGEAAGQALHLIFDDMKDSGVVALFGRMHPLLNQSRAVLSDDAEHIGNIVVIDTEIQNKTLETYRTNHRRDIRKATKLGVSTVFDKSCDNLEEFRRIYYETMRDLGAREYYFFDEKYLNGLALADEFRASLIFARYKQLNIGAILLLKTNNIIHYYLGGVDRDYIKLSPLKPMLAAAHEMAIREKIKYFVLGGGPGGLSDSLIRFKMGFSSIIFPFYVVKKIINPEIYKDICKSRSINTQSVDFFPAYRSNEVR